MYNIDNQCFLDQFRQSISIVVQSSIGSFKNVDGSHYYKYKKER